MKVRIKGDISGSRNGVPWPKRGETMELSDDEGAQLCASGLASPVKDSEKNVEEAVPDDSATETRSGLTTETAAGVTPGADPGDGTSEPDTPGADEPAGDDSAADGESAASEETEAAPTQKTAAPAAKKAPAKRTAAKPQTETK